MTVLPADPDAYLATLSAERRALVSAVRGLVNAHLPEGVEEGLQHGMIGWYVPHSVFPAGYHVQPTQPVPWAGLASQKKVSLHLFCAYVHGEAGAEFAAAYREWLGKKPDMGKSCVRFQTIEQVPFDLLAELFRKIPLDEFLTRYSAAIPASARKRRR